MTSLRWPTDDSARDDARLFAQAMRRERVALALVQGLLAGMTPEKEAVKLAVKLADELIAELDKGAK